MPNFPLHNQASSAPHSQPRVAVPRAVDLGLSALDEVLLEAPPLGSTKSPKIPTTHGLDHKRAVVSNSTPPQAMNGAPSAASLSR